MHTRKILALTPLLVALAACGNTYSGSGGQSSSGSPAAASRQTGAVLKVSSTPLGKILTDSSGRTVYMFTADSSGHSSCNAACLGYWPAVTPSAKLPQSLPGVSAKLGTTTTPTGTKIVTAGGWPLYTFVKDSKPGQVNGQGFEGFGGYWYVVSPSGHPMRQASAKSSGSGSGSASSSGSGGGSGSGGSGGGGYSRSGY